ncbi:MAG: glycosyltransferase [Desertifilum sp. SIO1I2]|nr:glycosyltransferase [Desertifilum sp. SIO1I2]
MSQPLVSIAINNYNYGQFLSDAIESALQQSYVNCEVIVVDDGSTDNSREIMASYGDRIIPVLKHNGGQASAFNAGFAASRGEIVCFLDADDLFLPDKVTAVVQAFGDRPELGWCFHPLKPVDIEAQPIDEATLYDGSLRQYDMRQQLRQGKLTDRFPPPSTSGLCFRRSLIQQILPMPEAKRIGLNDGYLEFTAIGLSPGLFIHQELGLYRLHGANAYAKTADKQRRKARIIILTGYWMRVKFPQFARYANNLIGAGLGIYWRAGGVEAESQEFLKKHLAATPLIAKLAIYLRAVYVYLKNPQD